MNNINIITISSDFGAGKKGANKGPQAVIDRLNSKQIGFNCTSIIPQFDEAEPQQDFAKHIDQIIALQEIALEKIQQEIAANNGLTLIISGDHSNGHVGISAVKETFPTKKIGVIWIDAHADIHNPGTTPSGNMHGMPLAMSLGLGISPTHKNKLSHSETENWNKLMHLGSLQISPKISPEHLVFIELRDFEPEEAKRIEELKIKAFTPEHRKENGIKAIAESALNYLADCDLLYVSFDVDSMDPSVSVGTGTPVENGLAENEAIELLRYFIKLPKLIALEITEVNPILDTKHPMDEIAARIIENIFKN